MENACSDSPGQRQGTYTKRILVTGGAGFIGSNLVITMVERHPEYYIINLDKLCSISSVVNLKKIEGKPNYKFVQADICDAPRIDHIFQSEKIDIVMHLAAQTHVDKSFANPLDSTSTNVQGTHVLINAAIKSRVQRFIHVSTDEVYGGKSDGIFVETSPLRPCNPYAASKAAAECIVMSYWECFKFPVIITRSNNVYGPRACPEKVIPKFISLLQRNGKCCIHGKGLQKRHFLYITDIIEAFFILLKDGVPGEIYNIGSDFELSTMELAEDLTKRIARIGGDDDLTDFIEHVDDRVFNDEHYPLDSSKIRALGWKPVVPWNDGIEKTIRWYKENFNNWKDAGSFLSPFPNESGPR